MTELIERHHGELPFSDQLPTPDPPTHINHRSLLMRLIRSRTRQHRRGVPGAQPAGIHFGARRHVKAER
jgi:hypothetical protein